MSPLVDGATRALNPSGSRIGSRGECLCRCLRGLGKSFGRDERAVLLRRVWARWLGFSWSVAIRSAGADQARKRSV